MPVSISDEWRAFVEALELPDDESDALLDPERVDAAIERLEAESMGWYVMSTPAPISP